jgi:hypothetical protein
LRQSRNPAGICAEKKASCTVKKEEASACVRGTEISIHGRCRKRERYGERYRNFFDDRPLPSLTSLSTTELTLPAWQPRKDQVDVIESLLKEAYLGILSVAGLSSDTVSAFVAVLSRLPSDNHRPEMVFLD